MIVAALATIVLAIIFREPKSPETAGGDRPVASVTPTPPGSALPIMADVAVAPGSTVSRVALDADRLVLVAEPRMLDAPGAQSEVIIVDITTGKVVSRIRLRETSDSPAGE